MTLTKSAVRQPSRHPRYTIWAVQFSEFATRPGADIRWGLPPVWTAFLLLFTQNMQNGQKSARCAQGFCNTRRFFIDFCCGKSQTPLFGTSVTKVTLIKCAACQQNETVRGGSPPLKSSSQPGGKLTKLHRPDCIFGVSAWLAGLAAIAGRTWVEMGLMDGPSTPV